MAESYNAPPAGQNPPAETNEQRIDGDGQEVNALRFLGAGGPPAPPPPAITPVTSGVSQPLQTQQQQPQATQPPLQQPAVPQLQHAQQPVPASGGFDYPDPSSYGSMQIPPGPMSGPFGMPGQVPGVMGGGPMMMMPPYNYMYPSPYYMPGPYPSMPSAPSNSTSQFLAYLNVLRVKDPKFYREWHKKYTAHKRNPDRVSFPQIPGFPMGGGPGSSQTLPGYGRSRKDSSRSSVVGDNYRHPHNDSFANMDYGPGGANTSMSHVYMGSHDRRQHSRSGATSVNGDYRPPPEDDFEFDGADMPSFSGVGGNSVLNSSHYLPSDRDRPPTQSGRSSAVGDPYYPDQQGDSLGYDSYNRFQPITEQVREPSPRRMTPMKFSTFHCIAAMSPLGHLVRIKNSGTVLEFVKLKQFLGHLPEYKEMESFSGPLIQGSTHKNTVIQFCKRKIKEARANAAQIDKDNYILLWEFLIVMLRQNGMVVGSDISELLLNAVKEEKKTVEIEEIRDNVEGGDDEEVEVPPVEPAVDPVVEPRDEEALVQEFCEHLLYGHKKDALEFAMDNGLWGHALFFASKMDERSYGHVLAKFANGIPLNSPLQTLYHIMCGKQPASVTSCAEESYGDWKPHLAMLLSNSGYKPQVEQKAILTLGDTLASRNHIFAAQFCYLMGHEEFRKESRLGPLLGYSPSSANVLEATQMTEVYEFARKLADANFSMGSSFLQSKLDYAKQLVSHGFVQEAIAYCEEITKSLKTKKIDDEELRLCSATLQIAERIAVADESGTANSTWVEDLRKMIAEPSYFCENFRKMSLISQGQSSDQLSHSSQQQQPIQPPEMFDPYNPPIQTIPASDPNAWNQPQYDQIQPSVPLGNVEPENTYSGTQGEIPQENHPGSNWNNSTQMNGGLHLSSPPMYDINSQPQPQPIGGDYSAGAGYDKLQTPTGQDNNNYWYYSNPPQPSLPNNDYASQPKEPDHNYLAAKKKSVRFEDEHDRLSDVENSLANGVSVLRCRAPIRPDSLDLKSAMKSTIDRQVRIQRQQNQLNGSVESLDKKHSKFNSEEKSLLEVEYKSTYPIDEPIEAVSRLNTKVRSAPTTPYECQNKTTFPVDKECCDVNEPCEDHDEYLGDVVENGTLDMTSKITGYEKTEIKNPPSQNGSDKKAADKKKSGKDKDILGGGNQQPGWFSGLFKFPSLKPKVPQMKLPDDKDATIKWDPNQNRWVNTAGDGEDDLAPAGPPPKDSEFMGPGKSNSMPNGPMPPMSNMNMQSVPPGANMQTQPQMYNQAAPAALHSLPMQMNNQPLQNPGMMNVSQQQQPNTEPMIPGMPPISNNSMNKYKLQKGRSLKNSYVDVLNPNASRSPNDSPAVPVNKMPTPQVPNMFIPPPSNQSMDGPVSFLTAPTEEVPIGQDGNPLPQAPPMFNPAQFQNQNSGYPQGQ